MSVITVFSGTHCREEAVVQGLASKPGFELVTDAEIAQKASASSEMGESKIMRAFSAKTSVFHKFTHEKERSIAYLKLALAQRLSSDRILVHGFVSHLLPKAVTHVLRVCLIADIKSRIALAVDDLGMSEKEAAKLIRRQDDDRAAWVHHLLGNSDPWSPALYDMVIPTDKTPLDEAISLIAKHAEAEVLKPSPASRKVMEDFLLSAGVEVALAEEGHNVGVSVDNGSVTLTINKHVLMLSRLEEELKSTAGKVPGVRKIETKVGKDFYQTDVYRKFDFELPSKVLLVDDEREFVQTLSERLLMRDMGSAVAYDGESALQMVTEEEPEVMILDLKMPGIDGIEVLKRVKETHPDMEVIILTGHGSEVDRETCMKLGAFAYLQKPVDIEVLSETIKRANEKIRHKKTNKKKAGVPGSSGK
jgi:two-component system, OmpR family, response regulator CpxR